MQSDKRTASGLLTAMFMTMAPLALPAAAQTLVITRSGTRTVRQAPPENFTGIARVDMLFDSLNNAAASGGSVTFEPGARTAWHSHPGGQTLIVTVGTGRVQRWGDAVEEIRAGDVVRIPAGQKHWHGAAPSASMTHIAITEAQGGTAVQWMEQVSEEQYNAAPTDPPAGIRPPGGPPEAFSSGSRLVSRRSPTMSCMAMSGDGPSCRRATAVS